MINVKWVQHPVGHGGFHTGIMTSSSCPPLTWIFDCGAKRTAKFDVYLRHWLQSHPLPIDWLFISHFDSDHVSGLETLMGRAEVVDVMVPYLNERELAVQLLYEASRDSLSRTLVELAADPAGYFLSRGAQRVTFLNGGTPDRTEIVGDPDGPRPEGRGWYFKCDPPPRHLKSPGWAKSDANGDSAVRVIDGECEFFLKHAGEGLRFKPYRAPFETATHDLLITAIKTLTGGSMSLAGRPGLGDLAYSVATVARTANGRKALRGIFKAHVGSSNRSSLSLLSTPLSSSNPGFWGVAHQFGGSLWDIARPSGWWWHGVPGEPAWLNTGDAEILSPFDLDDWKNNYLNDLDTVKVLSLPHHGSDHNSDASFQNLCPDAILAAHVNSTSKKHPGLKVALAAGARLTQVTEHAATQLEMWYQSS